MMTEADLRVVGGAFLEMIKRSINPSSRRLSDKWTRLTQTGILLRISKVFDNHCGESPMTHKAKAAASPSETPANIRRPGDTHTGNPSNRGRAKRGRGSEFMAKLDCIESTREA